MYFTFTDVGYVYLLNEKQNTASQLPSHTKSTMHTAKQINGINYLNTKLPSSRRSDDPFLPVATRGTLLETPAYDESPDCRTARG